MPEPLGLWQLYAGGNVAVLDAAAVDAFAHGDQILSLANPLGLLGGQPPRHVAHVVLGEDGGHALHDGVSALAGLELLQLLDQVSPVLLRQFGVGCDGGIAVGGAWQAAHTAA